jgi:hypothetical protein
VAGQAKGRQVETVARFRFDPEPGGRWRATKEFVEYFPALPGSLYMEEIVWVSYEVGIVSDARKKRMERMPWQ